MTGAEDGVGQAIDDEAAQSADSARRELSYPLSTAQLRWWVAQQLYPTVPITVALYLELRGPVDVELMRRCVEQAARELESPHLCFRMVDGQPRQYVDVAAKLPIRLADLSSHADPVAAALTDMARDHGSPLDPLAGELTAGIVYRIAAQHHLLYMRSHHIVLDGVGAASVLRRTGELYRDAVDGAHAVAGGAPMSVGALLDDERAYQDSARAAADRGYWLDQLAGLGDPVSLAGHPVAPEPRPHTVAGLLDAATAAHLAAARLRHGATFPELVVAAFACFLARMTGTEDAVLSLPVTARPTAALRRSAGSMSNVVPLRLIGVGAGTVGAVIEQVRLRVIGALRHQRYRYEDMQRDRGQQQVARGGFGPVVNVLGFVEPFRLGPLSGHVRLLSLGPVEDLLVNGYQLGPDERTVSIDFQANPARYRYDTVVWQHRLFLEYFGRFLAAEASCPIRDLDAPAPKQAAPQPIGRTRLLPELLCSGMVADAVAVQDGSRTMTYRKLDETSSRLARRLIAAGARPGEFVLVAVPRSLESVLALWAVAKSGACFVPIDPADPARRIARVIADSAARLGLTIRSIRANLPTGAANSVAPAWVPERSGEARESARAAGGSAREAAGFADTPSRVEWLALDDPEIATGFAEAPVTDADRNRPLRAAHPAYLIYTSGTTGMPKGVAVTHRGLGSLTGYIVDHYGVDRDSVVLHAHSPAFDAHLLELLATFAAGARLVVEPPAIVAGAELARLISDNAVTHFLTTPAVLATLAPAEVPTLRLVVIGGEAPPVELVRRWAPRVRLCNGYGPTETTVMATQTAAMTPDDPATIGPALPRVRVVLLDSRLAPAPHGARGELYLGGPCVAAGYHRAPAATATRFIADPAGTGERLYRTGDLVCARADGAFEFLGRADTQIALRGRRIEPSEIESMLTADPDIAQAVVTVADPGAPQARLIGYVVAAQGVPLDTSALLRRLRDALPAALVPAALIQLDRLPVSANGKLDRTALPAPGVAAHPYRAPETPAQRLVAEQFGKTTDQPTVGLDDDFFELGGNSLLGVAVSAELAAATGVPVTVRWLYTAPTVAALAQRIAGYDATADTAAESDDALGVLLMLRRNGSRPPLFCVHSAVPLAWCYAGLSRYITDRPVYGLQAPTLTGPAHGATTIDALADSYVAEMLRVQPDGPYHLLGWSLGGQIAHAVAVRLRARGHAVAVLAMLDSVVIPDGADPPPVPRMRDLLTHLLGDEPEDADALDDLTATEAAAELARAGASLGTGLTAGQLERLHRGYVDGVSLSHGYRPGVFDGDLLYFSATRGMTELLDARIWRPYVTGALIEHPVAATHAQLTNSDVVAVIGPILADHLTRLADSAAR
ncbi:amino acid adenylation domain-containing protein [Nocardia sp. NPDC052566]|uniref:amino acid adenylation domain-containing protein n=1 Tax=Nocardia sp. NPDC052566 TaxID=3364330 RepID=UPI0037C6BC1C